MKFEKLNFVIALVSIIAVVSFSFTISTDEALSLRDHDRDHDGIADDIDECPQISENYNKFEDEDGCPDTVIEEKTKYEFPDTDGDGFDDRVDNCITLPENFNGYLDYDGCPERYVIQPDDLIDSDSDSVPDSVDVCPDEKETINEFKDGDGCPDSLDIYTPSTHDISLNESDCRGNKVAVMRINTNDLVCVTLETAAKWEEYGIGQIVVKSDTGEGNLVVSSAEMMKKLAERQAMKEAASKFDLELSLLPEHFGGEGPITVTPIIGEVTKHYPEFYVPGTEVLDENEMRIFACGTGSPWVVPAQKGSCFLIQTGAGHNLIFDIGGGSIANLNSLGLAANDLNHIFVSHLHVDHVGDLDMFWAQGFMWGRTIPLTLHGPSSSVPELGTESFGEHFLKTWVWDMESKRGVTHSAGYALNVHEFDYSKTHVIYEENGLTVQSFPALHSFDGAVSYRIEWNGMSVVYSGDTTLNSVLVDNSKDADVMILQIFPSAKDMAVVYNTTVEIAQQLLDHYHISPGGAGALLQINEPRVPLLFHLNLFGTETVPNALSEIREYYDGPIIVGQDKTVLNVTPDYAVARQAQLNPALASSSPSAPADEEPIYHMSDWLAEYWYDLEGFKEQYHVEE